MERYIGLDVHAASTTMAVVGATGKVLRTEVVETNGQALIEALCSIAGKRHACLEEGTQSAWLYEILSPHVEEVVVVGVGQESRGPKSDAIDAVKLAEQSRTGSIQRRVYKDRGAYRVLRDLGRAHSMVVRDVVRVQSRLKSMYRSRGVAAAGKAVYGTKGRVECLKQLSIRQRNAVGVLPVGTCSRSRGHQPRSIANDLSTPCRARRRNGPRAVGGRIGASPARRARGRLDGNPGRQPAAGRQPQVPRGRQRYVYSL